MYLFPYIYIYICIFSFIKNILYSSYIFTFYNYYTILYYTIMTDIIQQMNGFHNYVIINK